MLPDRAAASYNRALASQFGPGEVVTIRRAVSPTPGDYQVSAWVTHIEPSDVTGSVQQLKRKAIVLASDVVSSGFPLPFLPKQDRLIWNGKTLVITAIDEGTRGIQGVVVAYELQLSGA